MEKQILQWFDEDYPQELLKIRNYPKVLHYIGNKKLLNNSQGIVAIVGARKCTEYGRKYARIFASELSKKGITIISGLAIGIDAQAHIGALKGSGNTIAVIAGGFNHITPDENKWLFNEIMYNKGIVITECEDSEEIKEGSYEKRNRIISGIADAVLIVEANKKSGSMITARHAFEQEKPIFCLPHRLDEECSSAMYELVNKGATIAMNIAQITNKIRYKLVKTEEPKTEKIVEVPEQYKEIYNALEKEKSKEEIKTLLKEPISEINAKLTIMELEGYIKQTRPNVFTRI